MRKYGTPLPSPIKLNKMSRNTSLTMGALCLLAACTDPEPTITERITEGQWRLEALTIDPAIEVSGTLITDYYNQLYGYDRDNIIRFGTDGTYTVDEGPTKELPTDPQTRTGHWLLSEAEDQITAWISPDTVVYGLEEVTDARLTLTYAERDTATQINYTFTAVFGR
jgi:hypothetical protein